MNDPNVLYILRLKGQKTTETSDLRFTIWMREKSVYWYILLQSEELVFLYFHFARGRYNSLVPSLKEKLSLF